jgi:hypothetical protein
VILGVNGLIWISAHPSTDDAASEMPSAQQQLRISRTSNAIRVLAKLNFSITPLRILEIYQVRLYDVSFEKFIENDGKDLPSGPELASSLLYTSQGFLKLWTPPPDVHGCYLVVCCQALCMRAGESKKPDA